MTATLLSTRRVEALLIDGDARTFTADALSALATLGEAGMAIGVVTNGRLQHATTALVRVAACGAVVVASEREPLGALADRSPFTPVERADGADARQWVLDELWAHGVGVNDVLTIDAASNGWTAALAAQVACRDAHDLPRVRPGDGWQLTIEGFSVDLLRVKAALFALADGRVGVGGAPLPFHTDARRWVLAGNTYAQDGAETRLLTAPVVWHVAAALPDHALLRRTLDLHAGLLFEEVETDKGRLRSVRFCSLARPGTAVLRMEAGEHDRHDTLLLPPSDDDPLDAGTAGDVAWMRVAGTNGGVAAAVTEHPDAGGTVDRIAVYRTSPQHVPDADGAVDAVRAAAAETFDRLLAEHRAAWARRWEDADVVIEGDEDMQRATRYALFHLMASVPDEGEAAVGARGLTGTGYRGHVFWDADTFTLPFLAATHPAAARAMLEYRVARLPAAHAAAHALGRAGARFPWESAHTGEDVTPTSARDRTGAIVPIRTGQLEEHIVAEVAWAACSYVDWTGDMEFAHGPGRRLLVDTARYWASRVRVLADGAHIFGVIGPDEYHEPVDDNAFTNVMARWNLRRAADVVEATNGPETAEAARWREVADALVDGYDADSGVYEQFAGFHRLEPLMIADVAPRRPIAADLLLGARRVRGAQVVKQADVLMLHHLVPDEVEPDSLEPNLRFYEPRTAHGSSLSPGVHASLFARTRDYARALDSLRLAGRIDLDDLTGATSSGLHLATMGSLWQALAFGFAGLRPQDGRLRVDPRLPHEWGALELRVRFHGSRVHVRVGHGWLAVAASEPVTILVDAKPYIADATGIEFARRSRVWEVTS